jgi:hypothetical protein
MDFETVVQSGLEIRDRTAYKSVRSDRSAVPQFGSASLVGNRSLIRRKDPHHKVDRRGKYEIQDVPVRSTAVGEVGTIRATGYPGT